MYDEIYQLLDKYNSKKRFIDKKFVLDTCDIIKYGLDLYDAVGKCHCDKTLPNFGNYNIATCEMNFNPKKKHNRDMKRFFPDIYHSVDNLKNGDLVEVDAKFSKRFDKYQIIVNNIKRK